MTNNESAEDWKIGSLTPANEWAMRWSIGIRVEEMGYEYPPFSPERHLCFKVGKEIQEEAQRIRDEGA